MDTANVDSTELAAQVLEYTVFGLPVTHLIGALLFVVFANAFLGQRFPGWASASITSVISGIHLGLVLWDAADQEPISDFFIYAIVVTLPMFTLAMLIIAFVSNSPWRLKAVILTMLNILESEPKFSKDELRERTRKELRLHKLGPTLFDRALKILESENAVSIEKEVDK